MIFPQKKINDEFRIVFKEEEEFYLLDNILTVGEKEKVLLGLNLKIKKERKNFGWNFSNYFITFCNIFSYTLNKKIMIIKNIFKINK